MRPSLLLWAAILIPGPMSAAATQDPSKDLTLDLYLDWERVSDPQISPDGHQIVYTRRQVDRVHDRWESELWIVDRDGGRNRFLTRGAGARWSPDGTRIAFTRQGDPRGTQLFVRWMDAEGATSQITHVEHTPSNIRWSPDGRSLAFVMTVPSPAAWHVTVPGRPAGAEWTPPPKVVTRLRYRRDRQGFIDDGYRHIFVVPADGGTPRQLTDGDWNHGSPAWAPDGSEILFSSLRVADAEHVWRESEIYAVRVADGTIRTLTTRHGPDTGPVVSPDGKLVAYTGYNWTDDTYVAGDVYVMDIDGSHPRAITQSLDRSARNLTWAPDNRGLYFFTDDHGRTDVFFASTGGDVHRVTQGNHRLQMTSMTDDLMAVGTLSGPDQPGDVVAFDLRDPDPVRLTRVNDDVLAGRRLGRVEEITYPSTGGLTIQGWIITPPDFDPSRKYPLILAIHGGPHGMYGVGFNFGWQNHAANGYVVLYTNPRGSSGYGSAFGNTIKNAYPGQDFDDLMTGVDTVINRGYIDEDNLFVYGCSGGGVLTAWIVGHTNRFAAASANCPVTNWLSFVGTTDGPTWYRNFASLPWEDPSEHLRRSPLMYVGNVTTPTMLMTGVKDLRTPMPQTEEFYMALRYRNVPTAMVRFNDEWHGTGSKPSNFMRTQLFLRQWFQRYQRPATSVSDRP